MEEDIAWGILFHTLPLAVCHFLSVGTGVKKLYCPLHTTGLTTCCNGSGQPVPLIGHKVRKAYKCVWDEWVDRRHPVILLSHFLSMPLQKKTYRIHILWIRTDKSITSRISDYQTLSEVERLDSYVTCVCNNWRNVHFILELHRKWTCWWLLHHVWGSGKCFHTELLQF